MTSTVDIRPAGAVGTPGRVGQATAVEQSRAVAEVQAAVIVAQQCPRDIQEALRQMRDSCNRMALAERAFFRVPRGDEVVSRPSVHLARELARIWGNIDYGTAELRRDDEHKQSEMLAFAWDLQTNSRSRATFIVPHRRDLKGGRSKDLVSQQDIYENNANNGARRLREVIFAALPGWFVEEAQDICARRISEGDGTPLADRLAKCVDKYAKIGVTVAQLEAKTGSEQADWTPNDLAQLGVIYQSIMRNEISKNEEFPPAAERVGADGIRPAAAPVQEPASNGVAKEEAATPPKTILKRTLGKVQGALHAVKLGNTDETAMALSALTGRPVKLPSDLHQDEAERLLALIDAKLEAAQGDTQAAADMVWERAKAALAAREQDASTEPAAEGEVPDGGA